MSPRPTLYFKPMLIDEATARVRLKKAAEHARAWTPQNVGRKVRLKTLGGTLTGSLRYVRQHTTGTIVEPPEGVIPDYPHDALVDFGPLGRCWLWTEFDLVLLPPDPV